MAISELLMNKAAANAHDGPLLELLAQGEIDAYDARGESLVTAVLLY